MKIIDETGAVVENPVCDGEDVTGLDKGLS